VELYHSPTPGDNTQLIREVIFLRTLSLSQVEEKLLPKSTAGLSARELEIVALIADGKSNIDIADQLVLSKRTVEKHVANILGKLDFTNRTQVARWATENKLTQPKK
jgi:DNA-binding NarL/FixJ family response regulator